MNEWIHSSPPGGANLGTNLSTFTCRSSPNYCSSSPCSLFAALTLFSSPAWTSSCFPPGHFLAFADYFSTCDFLWFFVPSKWVSDWIFFIYFSSPWITMWVKNVPLSRSKRCFDLERETLTRRALWVDVFFKKFGTLKDSPVYVHSLFCVSFLFLTFTIVHWRRSLVSGDVFFLLTEQNKAVENETGCY